MQALIEQLNEAQRAPVLQKEGPMMIIAGAGSGKTRVLTVRIAYLISLGVDPFNILALTFTNKAAREMKHRIGQMVGNGEARNLWMGTFHAVFAKILRIEADKLGYPNNFTIYDTQDSVRLISAIIKEMQLDKDVYKPKQVFSRISSYKNNLITVKAYFNNPELQESDAMSKKPRMGQIYHEYVERCFKAGAMDFDDLLLRTNELLNRFPDVLAKYQERFRYIMVDEYQDTNHSQYLIVRALSDRFQNICVVGDDAQSIYAFRGANINNILNFNNDYQDVKTYRLEQNYRSTKHIVEAANSVIDKNKTKLDKLVWTANQEGPKIKVHRSLTDGEEGRFVAQTIYEERLQHQRPYRDFAILYRTNAQSRAMEDALRKRDIPYRIYGGLSFYQRKEIKDVLCYMRLVVNPNDEEALVRVINYPHRGIGDTTIEKLTVASKQTGRSIFTLMEHIDQVDLKIQSNTKQKLQDFVWMIKSFQVLAQEQDAFVVAEQLTRKTGLLQELKKDATPEGVSRVENIEELLNGIKDFTEGQKQVEGAHGALTEFLEDVALATDLDQDQGDDERVALMTIHLAKGLEFPVVFIVGMEEDLFPSALSLNTRSELEEERRLFYVAITRAEYQVYLSYAQSRYRWGKLCDSEPSRFIEEIDVQYLEYLFDKGGAGYSYKPQINLDIFGDVDKSKLRLNKPTPGTPPPSHGTANTAPIRRLKPMAAGQGPAAEEAASHLALREGQKVLHDRFGVGKIVQIEGFGPDKKAAIDFDHGGIKKILLRFARLTLLDD